MKRKIMTVRVTACFRDDSLVQFTAKVAYTPSGKIRVYNAIENGAFPRTVYDFMKKAVFDGRCDMDVIYSKNGEIEKHDYFYYDV